MPRPSAPTKSLATRTLAALATASFLALAGPGAANAQSVNCDRAAAPSGNDGAAGTLDAPVRSMQKLASLLAPGQTGCMREGSYTGNVLINRGGTDAQPITIRSYPGERARHRGLIAIRRGGDNVRIEQMYLNGANNQGDPSPIVNARNVVFRHNDVTNDNTAICFVLGSAAIDNDASFGRATNTLLDANKIHNCGKLPARNHDHGVYVEATDGVRIQDNWIYDNADRGIQFYPEARGSIVTGNVIDGNGQGVSFGGEGGYASTDNKVSRNVISNSRVRANVESWWGEGTRPGAGNVVSQNCLSGGSVDSSNGGFSASGNVTQAASYANRSRADFRVRSGCESVYSRATAHAGPDVDAGGALPALPVVVNVNPGVIAPSRPVTVLGKVPAAQAGTVVVIKRKVKGKWRRVAKAKTRANGRFKVRTKFRVKRGSKAVRLRASAGKRNSRAVRVKVKRAKRR